MKKVMFKISGMHCTSCAMDIDGSLEDMDGVASANTSYAKAQTEVEFDPEKVSEEILRGIIGKSGYKVE